ncbi:MAG: outer membrane beta-barrel protein [Pyrinomonadaceae bacterium]
MQRIIFTALLIFGSACVALAQTPADYPKNEFFVGYSYHSADINTLTIDPDRKGQHGINLSYTRNIRPNVGLVADASAHFYRDSRSTGGGTFSSQRDQYFLVGGVQFKSRNSRRVQPFAHALVGASLFRGFTSNSTGAGIVYTFDDATSLAMVLGGGLDVRLSKRIDLRLVQADYSPTFFGSGRQNNIRLSFGIVFKK